MQPETPSPQPTPPVSLSPAPSPAPSPTVVPTPASQASQVMPEPAWYHRSTWSILVVANVITLVIPFILSAVAFVLIPQAAGYLVGAFLGPLFMVGAIVAIANTVLISRHIIKNKPGALRKVLEGLVVVVSALYVAILGYNLLLIYSY